MKGFIYIIRNTINNKVYIGQTRTTIHQRWREHVRRALYGKLVLNKAMKKYGVENFYINILEICSVDILDEREIYYINKYDSTNKDKGYNISIGCKTPQYKKKVLDSSTIISLYTEKLYPLEKIASLYNVTRYIITSLLRSNNVKIRDRHVSSSKFNKFSKEEILEVLAVGKSIRKSAKLLKISKTALLHAIKYYNIEYNFSKSVRQ